MFEWDYFSGMSYN